MRIRLIITIICLTILPSLVFAATCEEHPVGSGNWYPGSYADYVAGNAAAINKANVEQCISSASGGADWQTGDTVYVGEGDVTWSGTLGIGKGISLIGRGCGYATDSDFSYTGGTMTKISNASQIISITGTQGPRVSGFHFTETTASTYMIVISPSGFLQNFRIDHNYLYNSGLTGEAVRVYTGTDDHQVQGVSDHNYLKNTRFQNTGVNTKFLYRKYDTDVSLGGVKTHIIEDNKIDRSDYPAGSSVPYTCVDGENGNSYVFRYNTNIDCYGLAHPPRADRPAADYDMARGMRYWEVYGNTFADTGGKDEGRVYRVRSGTGVMFNNTVVSGYEYSRNDVLIDIEERLNPSDGADCTETDSLNDLNLGSPYPIAGPCRDQVGFASDTFEWENDTNIPSQTSEPAYFWDFTNFASPAVTITALYDDNLYTAKNRDWYFDNDSHMQTGTYTQMLAVSSPTSGDGFWVTNRGGDWDKTNETTDDGSLYVYSGSTWEQYYTPYTYPHPLTGSDSAAPTISITSPTSDATYDNGGTATINLGGTASDETGLLRVEWSNATTGDSGNCSGTSTWTASDIPLDSGENLIIVTAYDTSSNTKTDSITVTYTDGTAPVISDGSPSGELSCTEDPRTVIMSVTTDEDATCKYSTSYLAYASMENTFSTTGSTSHSQSLSVSCGSAKTYYVRCTDGYGNTNSSSTVINFSVESGSATGFNMTYNADSAQLSYGAGSAPLTLQ